MRRAVLLVFLILVPGAAAAQDFHLSTGYMNFGPVAKERTHRVLVGNIGNDQYFAAGVEGRLFEGLDVVAKALVAPTWMTVWPCEDEPCGERSRWHTRPPEGEFEENFVWSVLNLGLATEAIPAVRVAGGVSLTTLSMCRYMLWGACPMHSPGLYAEVSGDVPLGRDLRLGLEAGTAPVLPREGRFSVIDALSGVHGVEPGGSGESTWIVPLWLGLRLSF